MVRLQIRVNRQPGHEADWFVAGRCQPKRKVHDEQDEMAEFVVLLRKAEAARATMLQGDLRERNKEKTTQAAKKLFTSTKEKGPIGKKSPFTTGR